jgi:uncharacterized damage-inducible protein DinB
MEPELNNLPEKAIKLINHILSSHRVWNSRILNQPSTHPWEMRPFENLIQINTENYQQTLGILEKSNLSEIITYQNTKGEIFHNKTEDILFHLINHGTYHRGQIALLFRESGIEPMVSDYIFYKRMS